MPRTLALHTKGEPAGVALGKVRVGRFENNRCLAHSPRTPGNVLHLLQGRLQQKLFVFRKQVWRHNLADLPGIRSVKHKERGDMKTGRKNLIWDCQLLALWVRAQHELNGPTLYL